MRVARLQSLAQYGIGFDTETYAISRGYLAPRLVCGSAGWLEGDNVRGALLDKQQALETFVAALENPDAILIGANIAFDAGVLSVELARRGIDVMPLLFRAFEEQRVFDIQIAESLHAIAQGHLGKDPRTGGPLTNPETGKRGRYSLATCVDLVLGRTDAKANDQYHTRYGEFDGIPIDQWPAAAREYPVDDAINTASVALAQAGFLPKVSPQHTWGNVTAPDGTTHTACVDCGSTRLSAPCITRRPHRNLHDLANQTWTAFAMHLGAVRGFRVNQASVDIIERHALRNKERGQAPFVAAGIIRADGSEDRSELKRRIAIAYGATDPCPVCNGTGKVPSTAAKPVRCPDCRGFCLPTAKSGPKQRAWAAEHPNGCATCANTGKVPNPNPLMVTCFVADEASTDVEGAKPDKIKTCDGTGFVLHEGIPRSDKEGIAYGRDALSEAGDEELMAYAGYQEDSKDLSVYVPYLRRARVPANGHLPECPELADAKKDCTCPGPYVDVPLTLRPNPVLETGRVSYDGVIQLFKRQPGHVDKETGEYVPSLRECIEAREGFVLASVDYDSGELITHAQNTIWVTGRSALADALINNIKVHHALGATMIGLDYAEFLRRFDAKDKFCKNARQAAKPGNFGFPGGLGPVKLVLQQRKQGPDTPHPSGPALVKDDDGNLVPGYRGLRFCLLMDGAEACGVRKARVWNERPIPPTCEHCIRCAQRLKAYWLRQWPENNDYFRFINHVVEHGQLITAEALERWPHLKEVYAPDTQLAPGEIMQHVSGRIRGGVDYCSGANGEFQGLLGDAAKAAVRRISRECYDSTYRVPDMTHENSKRSAYAGTQSPLLGSHLIVFQHDEVIPEIPLSVAHDGATRLGEIMVEELAYYCPDLAPAVKAPPALMFKWLKSAEPVRHGGRLVPWTPDHNPKKCAECQTS